MIKFTQKLQVPKVWKELLAIADFERLKNLPSKHRKDDSVDDPTPYRDDCREVNVQHGGYNVILCLYSGNNNYWMGYLVYKGEEGEIVYEYGEPFDELPTNCSDHLKLSDGEEIFFDVEYV